jgi:tungstate transport system substrate-binding protein
MVAFVAVTVVFAALSCHRRAHTIRLATTTSVESSGLLPVLVEAFKQDSRINVQAIAVGSGAALNLLMRHDAEVGLVHDPEAERRAIDAGWVERYRKLMFNDFVIAGPSADPALARQATTAVDAMQRIARSGSRFASRGDSSGTHAREKLLWQRAGQSPQGSALIDTGQGMAPTLYVASERAAYVLVDRSTFRQLASSTSLALLYDGDPMLINTYSVIVPHGVSPEWRADAEHLFDWLTGDRGQNRISTYQLNGTPLFVPWPSSVPRDRPEDMPSPTTTGVR